MTVYNMMKKITVAKREAVAGTAETLADADFDVRIRGVEFTPDIQGGDEDSKFVDGTYAEDVAISGFQGGTMTNETKLAASSTDLATAPKYGKLLEGCGSVSTTYGVVGIQYEPLSSGDKQTLTLQNVTISNDSTPVGIGENLAGVMGNFTLGAEGVGSVIKMAYDWKGKFSGQTDIPNGSLLALTAPDTSTAVKFMSGTATIGGSNTCIQSFSLDAGNTVEYLPCPDEATGVLYASIVNRQPRMTMTILADSVAGYDPFTIVVGQTVEAVQTIFGDFTLDVPQMQVLSYSVTEVAGGRRGYELTCKLLGNNGSNSDLADESTWALLQGARA